MAPLISVGILNAVTGKVDLLVVDPGRPWHPVSDTTHTTSTIINTPRLRHFVRDFIRGLVVRCEDAPCIVLTPPRALLCGVVPLVPQAFCAFTQRLGFLPPLEAHWSFHVLYAIGVTPEGTLRQVTGHRLVASDIVGVRGTTY